MSRLRYTLEEAEVEAIRLARSFVGEMPNCESARLLWAVPDRMAPKSHASKYPVVWNVLFAFHPPEVVLDGGEVTIIVNLQNQTATLSEW